MHLYADNVCIGGRLKLLQIKEIGEQYHGVREQIIHHAIQNNLLHTIYNNILYRDLWELTQSSNQPVRE